MGESWHLLGSPRGHSAPLQPPQESQPMLPWMLRLLLTYSSIAIPAAESTRSGQHQLCRNVQKEARRGCDSSLRNGLRHGHRYSGGIKLITMGDLGGFAAAPKTSWATGQACAVACRMCAERFTFLARPRRLRELSEGVMRCRRAPGRRVGCLRQRSSPLQHSQTSAER